MRCPELARLRKPVRWSYIKFIRSAPSTLPNPTSGKFTNPIDPTHPAVKTNRSAFPVFEHDALKIHAYPSAVLSGPSSKPLALHPVQENNKHVHMRLPMITSIKNTSKCAVVRMTIRRRIKHALELIIARGANAGNVRNGKVQRRGIVFDDNEAKEMGPKWVLNGWVYISVLKLPVYRMPYHELVPLLRLALQTLYAHGMYLEHRWAEIRSKKEGHHV